MRILHYTQEMENPDETNESPADGAQQADSIGAWINRAKRAHELVDAVDLERIAIHDKGEIEKLETVTEALDELSHGKDVEHVEGVDSVLPELDPEQQRKSELLQTIAEGGFAERIGRVLFISDTEPQLKPLELIPHQEGLPGFDVCVAPDEASHTGNFGLFISSQAIFAAMISDPPTTHHWRVVQSGPHENADEMIDLIKQFSANAFD